MVHCIGAVSVAVCTMGEDFIPAALLFMVLGFFYLVVEFPIVLLGMWLLRKAENKYPKVYLIPFLYVCSLGLGYLVCFREGGVKPPDYLVGFMVGAVLGCSVVVIDHLIESKKQRERGSLK